MVGMTVRECVQTPLTFGDLLHAGVGAAELFNLGIASQFGDHARYGRKNNHEPQPDEGAALMDSMLTSSATQKKEERTYLQP